MGRKSTRIIHYIRQSLFAGIFVFLVLLVMDYFTDGPGLLWAVGLTSIASSTFIVFTQPCCGTHKSITIIGAYLTAILVGIICSHFETVLWHYTPLTRAESIQAGTAVSIMISLFLQSILSFRHAPAAGLALVLTLESWNYATLMVIIVSMFVLVGLSYLLKPYIRDLS